MKRRFPSGTSVHVSRADGTCVTVHGAWCGYLGDPGVVVIANPAHGLYAGDPRHTYRDGGTGDVLYQPRARRFRTAASMRPLLDTWMPWGAL
jgi:hypothetical protein